MALIPRKLFSNSSAGAASPIIAFLFSAVWFAVLYWSVPHLIDAMQQLLASKGGSPGFRVFVVGAVVTMATYWFAIGCWWLYTDGIKRSSD